MWYNKKRRKEGEEMTLEITTPAVMFPSVSLLLLAYTNRFLALAGIVRSMDHCSGDEYEISQIENLKKRMVYIKRMQYLGVSSLLMCVISMFFIFFNHIFSNRKQRYMRGYFCFLTSCENPFITVNSDSDIVFLRFQASMNESHV